MIGYAFLGLAGAAVLCNLFLGFYKNITGIGRVSFFPLVVSLSGIPALFLLWDERGTLMYAAVAGIVLFDFVGQALIPKMFFWAGGEAEDQLR